jgi:hypothetical protein
MEVPLFEADKYSYFEFLSLRQRYENMALLPTAETVPNHNLDYCSKISTRNLVSTHYHMLVGE